MIHSGCICESDDQVDREVITTTLESPIALALHGGAGVISRSNLTLEEEQEYRSSLKDALDAGYNILERGGSALDAVEMAVRILEDCPLFNAGRGSVFSSNGDHEMDASIMCGLSKKAGAIAAVSGIKNPIQLARVVMEKTPHVLVIGKGAMELATKHLRYDEYNIPPQYFYTDFRYKQLMNARSHDSIHLDHSISETKFGTVGAVALDVKGNCAAGTSTGGMTNKIPGRVGDSAIIGAGTYASNGSCAVSCTGHGEYMIRGVVAYDISCLMEYKAYTLEAACQEVVLNKLKRMGGEGGVIAVDHNGNVSMPFTTPGMYRAARNNLGHSVVAIFKDDNNP